MQESLGREDPEEQARPCIGAAAGAASTFVGALAAHDLRAVTHRVEITLYAWNDHRRALLEARRALLHQWRAADERRPLCEHFLAQASARPGGVIAFSAFDIYGAALLRHGYRLGGAALATSA